MACCTKCSESKWNQIQCNSIVNHEFSSVPNGISRSDIES